MSKFSHFTYKLFLCFGLTSLSLLSVGCDEQKSPAVSETTEAPVERAAETVEKAVAPAGTGHEGCSAHGKGGHLAHGDPEQRAKGLQEKFGLTDEQREKVQSIFIENEAALKAIHEQMRTLHDEMKTAHKEEGAGAVGSTGGEGHAKMKDVHAEKKSIRDSQKAQIRELLTPEQVKKFDAFAVNHGEQDCEGKGPCPHAAKGEGHGCAHGKDGSNDRCAHSQGEGAECSHVNDGEACDSCPHAKGGAHTHGAASE